MKDLKRFEMVELPVTANNAGRFSFNAIPQLRNQADQQIIIQAITVFTVSTYTNSQNNNAVPGIALAEVPKVALVLYVNGEESVRLIPLALLITIQDFASVNQQVPYAFQNLQNVDFEKSYVQFNAAAAGTPYVIPFGIHYDRLVMSSNAPMMPNAATGNAWVQG